MHNQFDIVFDKVDTMSYPDLLEEQKDYFLNEAQRRLVKIRYREFDQTQKRKDDLSVLVKTIVLPVGTSTTLDDFKSYKVNLQLALSNGDKYLFYLKGNAQVSNSKCKARYVPIRKVEIDDLDNVLEDPFNKPSIEEVVATDEDGGLVLWADLSFNISNLRLTYLKQPRTMDIFSSVDCELSEEVQSEIIALAVQLALENVESGRLQSKATVDNTTLE